METVKPSLFLNLCAALPQLKRNQIDERVILVYTIQPALDQQLIWRLIQGFIYFFQYIYHIHTNMMCSEASTLCSCRKGATQHSFFHSQHLTLSYLTFMKSWCKIYDWYRNSSIKMKWSSQFITSVFCFPLFYTHTRTPTYARGQVHTHVHRQYCFNHAHQL